MDRKEFEKSVTSRFNNTDSGYGNMTQRERILLQIASNIYDQQINLSDIRDCLPLGKDWTKYMISPSMLHHSANAVSYEAGFKDCLIEINKRIKNNSKREKCKSCGANL